jgi:hypothetical protein
LPPIAGYLSFLSTQNLKTLHNRLLADWARKPDNKAKIASLNAQLANDPVNIQLRLSLARCYVIAGHQLDNALTAYELIFKNNPDERESFDFLFNNAIKTKDYETAQLLINKVDYVDTEIIQVTFDELLKFHKSVDDELASAGIFKKRDLRKAQNIFIDITRYSLGLCVNHQPEQYQDIAVDKEAFGKAFGQFAALYEEQKLHVQEANNYRISVVFFESVDVYFEARRSFDNIPW